MQVLKTEIRDRILRASEKIFYEKDYRSAKLTDIAKEAQIPVALIYTYFKNKETLFDETVESAYNSFISFFKEEENLRCDDLEQQRPEKVGEMYIQQLLKDRKKIVILMDKSKGTKHEKAKDKLVEQIQRHIEIRIKKQSRAEYEPILFQILASNFAEGLVQIARMYKNETWARKMLNLMAQYYFTGVESL